MSRIRTFLLRKERRIEEFETKTAQVTRLHRLHGYMVTWVTLVFVFVCVKITPLP